MRWEKGKVIQVSQIEGPDNIDRPANIPEQFPDMRFHELMKEADEMKFDIVWKRKPVMDQEKVFVQRALLNEYFLRRSFLFVIRRIKIINRIAHFCQLDRIMVFGNKHFPP